ncbi:hypothetical protein Tco_0879011 [Tanacetum coccineum]
MVAVSSLTMIPLPVDACCTVPTPDWSLSLRWQVYRGLMHSTLPTESSTALSCGARARGCCGIQGELSLGCEVFGGGKNNHFAGLDDFRHKVEVSYWRSREDLSYASSVTSTTEELYPHICQQLRIAEWPHKPWFAPCCHDTLEFAGGTWYNQKALRSLLLLWSDETLGAASYRTAGARLSQLQYHIFASPRDILILPHLRSESPVEGVLWRPTAKAGEEERVMERLS